jgi:hypothetical protein
MRTLVVGDIHGKLDLFNLLLEKMEYRAGEDRLILIGDLVDRGENSRGVVARAIELKREAPNNVIVLRGNHEAMMLAALSHPEGEQAELWYYNGGIETLQSYMDEEGDCDVPEEHWDFLASLPTWYEDDHAIYVHASLPEGLAARQPDMRRHGRVFNRRAFRHRVALAPRLQRGERSRGRKRRAKLGRPQPVPQARVRLIFFCPLFFARANIHLKFGFGVMNTSKVSL